MIAVSNSSPLIHLSNINKFSLLNYFYEEVFIPKAVYDEVVVRGKRRPGTYSLGKIEDLKGVIDQEIFHEKFQLFCN